MACTATVRQQLRAAQHRRHLRWPGIALPAALKKKAAGT
jgi:hypothetical protein